MNHRKYYLLNYIFILGIILLFLNDHFLKWEYSNWVTGKLSDVVGLLIFPFFLTFLFPKSKKLNVLFTGIFFLFWKSPFSQGFIDFYNSITFIEITRVVDYSDYIALFILPLSYYCLKSVSRLSKFQINTISIHPILILLPSVIVFMATSPPYWHGFRYSEGDIQFFKNTINIRISQDDILKRMQEYNIEVVRDTSYKNNLYNEGSIKRIGFYKINKLIIDMDTIYDLKFSMASFKENKTKIFINAMKVSGEIKEDEVEKELRKYYRKILKRYLKKSIKH